MPERTLEVHSIAQLVPPMSEEEYAGLKQDIAAHGQREAIVLFEGKILDGRNRYRACRELNIAPVVRQWNGAGSAVDFVISENLHRRHLSASQRGSIAVESAAMKEAEEKAAKRQREGGRKGGSQSPRKAKLEEIVPQPSDRQPQTRDDAAKIFGVNPRYVQDAKAVLKADPAVFEQVKAGELTLPQAKQQIRRQEKRKHLEEQAAIAPAASDRWSIRQGDCLDVLADIEEPARLVFADPPYNIGIDYGDGSQADRLADNKYLAWCEQWLAACRDRLSPDGSLWVLIGDEYAAEYVVAIKRLGLHMRSWLKWFESFGVNCQNNFNRCSRHLLYCVRDPKQFVFHEDAVSRPSDRQVKYDDRRAAPAGKLWDNVWGINPPIPRLTGTSSERVPDFPTQLPLALLTPIVLCASDPGDLVIDPFSGSGTTAVAAIRNGRRFIGSERSERFVELARLRLQGENR